MGALVIAGVSSGVGKTTIATGIMGALVQQGLRVQPFKVGPDYIDPTYHSAVTGIPSRNLDSWMLSRSAIAELFTRATIKKDIAVIEGVMGLYDGLSGEDDTASTAEMAKLLKAPVILVVDVSKMARSAAAEVMGYRQFDPALNLAGVILNGVAGEGHLRAAAEPIERDAGIPVLGYLPGQEELRLPERHLGLIPTVEGAATKDFFHRLVEKTRETIDLPRLLEISDQASPPHPPQGPNLFPTQPIGPQIALAVAQDRAFSFYYEDNLDLLKAWGAEIAPFSPLADSSLPQDISGIYIGGGFPEQYAGQLAENEPMKQALREAAQKGMPLYGECGGLMYLGRGITDFEDRRHGMVNLIPAWSYMQRSSLTLGYRVIKARSPGPLLHLNQEIRGHEFHWSDLEEPLPEELAAYDVVSQGSRREGYQQGNVLASYVHLHFGSARSLAPNFVDACKRWRHTQ